MALPSRDLRILLTPDRLVIHFRPLPVSLELLFSFLSYTFVFLLRISTGFSPVATHESFLATRYKNTRDEFIYDRRLRGECELRDA